MPQQLEIREKHFFQKILTQNNNWSRPCHTALAVHLTVWFSPLNMLTVVPGKAESIKNRRRIFEGLWASSEFSGRLCLNSVMNFCTYRNLLQGDISFSLSNRIVMDAYHLDTSWVCHWWIQIFYLYNIKGSLSNYQIFSSWDKICEFCPNICQESTCHNSLDLKYLPRDTSWTLLGHDIERWWIT